MNLLEEMILYIRTNPTGVLFLDGEWGCGKTYFIDNDLRIALANTHVLIRISLFGKASEKELERALLRAWWMAYCEEKGCSQTINIIEEVADVLSKIPISSKIQNLLNNDWLELLEVRNVIFEKQVVLVFDDLERAEMNITKVFGFINENFERLKVPIIILVNEGALFKRKKIYKYYSEMKEKIAQQNIYFQVDYDKIIKKIIQEQTKGDYQKFLLEHCQNLCNLFQGTMNNKEYHFHNLRSFRSSIQNFEYLYNFFLKYKMSKDYLKSYLLSFVAFYMMERSGVLNVNVSEWEIAEQIRIVYGAWYDEAYMWPVIRQWIIEGVLDEDEFIHNIQEVCYCKENIKPENQVRSSDFFELDEDVFKEGFPIVLNEAYSFKLTLREYVRIIEHISRARVIGYDLPCCVDWDKIEKGIHNRIKLILDEKITEPEIRYKLDLNTLCDKEKLAYQNILEYWEQDKLVFEKNYRYYMEVFSEKYSDEWYYFIGKKYNRFDEEMAKVTFLKYLKMSNRKRWGLQRKFKEFWESCCMIDYFNKNESLKGFEKFHYLLVKEKDKQYEEGNKITATVIEGFIHEIIEIINLIS